jgi:hypothetical protein
MEGLVHRAGMMSARGRLTDRISAAKGAARRPPRGQLDQR